MIFLKWFPYDKRNEAISSAIGAKCFFIYALRKRSKLNAPIRYIMQLIKQVLLSTPTMERFLRNGNLQIGYIDLCREGR